VTNRQGRAHALSSLSSARGPTLTPVIATAGGIPHSASAFSGAAARGPSANRVHGERGRSSCPPTETRGAVMREPADTPTETIALELGCRP